MISSAPSCLNSGFKLPRTRAAAARSFARRSSLTPVPTGVITILLPSKLNDTSLPGATPAAMRMCLGIVTCPLSVMCMAFLVGIRSWNPTTDSACDANERRLRRQRLKGVTRAPASRSLEGLAVLGRARLTIGATGLTIRSTEVDKLWARFE